MKVGVVMPIAHGAGEQPKPYTEIRALARQAEGLGFDSIWVFDHLLFRFPDEGTGGIHECWTILSALAEATERVELGTLVMCTSFRNPGVLAKMAAALDEVSEGRLILGLGCGWHDPEYEAFGLPTDHRVGRFEEALAIILPLLREGKVDFRGRWYEAPDSALVPPAPRPDMPILIASKGPRMNALTAQYGTAWNTAWFGMPDERLEQRRAALREAVDEAGRDPETLDETVGVTVRFPDLAPADDSDEAPDPARVLTGSAADVAAGLRAYEEIGIRHVICSLDPAVPAAMERLGEALVLSREGAAARV